MRIGIAAGAIALGCAFAGCRCARADSDPAPVLAPLAAGSSTAPLAVGGFGAAVVSVPGGATRAAPVLVAVLGIGDTPEEQCGAWHDIVGDRAFVLCPRGAPHWVEDVEEGGPGEAPAPDDSASESSDSDGPAEASAPTAPVRRPDAAARTHQVGFYPVDLGSLEREVAAALGALKSRYGAYVADEHIVFAGFSRGAFLGAQLAAKRPERYRRLVLIEGGQTPWQKDTAVAFARGGGQRVLFACGQPSCVDESGPAAAVLRAERVDTRVIHGVGEGHGYKRQVKEELRRSFDWLTDGEDAWLAARR